MEKCKYFQILEETINNVLSEIEKSHELEVEKWKSLHELALNDKNGLYQLARRKDLSDDKRCEIADLIYYHGTNNDKKNEKQNVSTDN